jgi:hypothetical protein
VLVAPRGMWPCPGQLLHKATKKLGRFEQPGTS